MTQLDELAQVLDATGMLVAAVRDEQWSDPTPCSEWNVRELLGHLVGGNVMFARLVRGDAASFEEARPADPLGGDPPAAYRAAAEEVLAAFRRPGALERTVTVPFGSVPGAVAVRLRVIESLVHGWDLARATGQEARYPDDLVERELKFTLGALGDIPPTRRPFGPPQPVADDAPAIDRLVAHLGRSVA
jgi:uncharacterized protein (TIGR03086 family)